MEQFSDLKIASLSVKASELPSQGSGSTTGYYNAKVLDFQGGKAVLEIEGRVVLADSEVPLKLGGEFRLAVKGYETNGKVQLQVVGAQENGSSTVKSLTNTMISSRLIGFDLPEHALTTDSARALMNVGAAVTKENMQAMLTALPQDADARTVQFAASLVNEGLPLSRELIQMLPLLTSELENLPAAMQTVGEAAAQIGQQDVEPLVAPRGDDAAALLQKLPDFIRAFLHSTESRLQAMSELNIQQQPGAAVKNEFIQQLVSLIKIIPETAPQETGHIDRAIQTLTQQLSNIDLKGGNAPAFEQIRSDLMENLARAAELPEPQARFEAIRAAVTQTITTALNEMAAPQEQATTAPPALNDPLLASLPESARELASQFQDIFEKIDTALPADRQAAPAAVTESIVSTASRAALLLSFSPDAETMPATTEFTQAAAQWTAQALELIAQTEPENLASDKELASLAERIQLITKSPEFGRELETLVRNFGSATDIRASLSGLASQESPAAQAATTLSLALQSAGLANLAQNNGVANMDSYVAYFPIDVDGKVQIGKLKVYRNEEGRRDKTKGPKPLNPFDSRLVLVLDTEFLGLTSISLQTYPNRGIKCDIEVKDARRKKIVEKFAEELREALGDTAYEQNTVKVSVRRRKKDIDPGVEPQPDVVAIDLRI